MTPPTSRRAGRLAFVTFVVLLLVFAGVVIWLVTAPVRELRSAPRAPAEAPAAQPKS